MKPTEVRLVAGLLEKPAADAEDLARQIIESLDEKRARDDEQWVVVYQWKPGGHLVTCCWGPYPTRTKAERATREMVSPSEPLARAMILRVDTYRDTPKPAKATAKAR